MSTPEIKVRIVGDSKGLESAANDAKGALDKLNQSIGKLEQEIADNIRISSGYESAIESLNQELRNGSISQDQFRKSLSRLKRDEAETVIETKRLRAELNNLKRDQKNLSSAFASGAGSAKGFKKQITGTTPTLLEFNRVIQDAPFGIQGVGNNIQQLVGNFQNLSKNAGGSVAAFRALAGSFIGPAGILFVVSAATSLLTVYGDKLFKAKDASAELKKETEAQAEKLKNFVDGLRGVDRAQLEAQKSSIAQLTTLRQLRSQIEDTSLATDVRRDAIVKLRKEFPAYFQGISDEKLLNGQVAGSYDILTNSIIKRARATAATNILVENLKEEFEATKRIQQIETELAKTQSEKIKAKQEEDRLNKSIGQNRGVTTGAQLSQQTKVFNLTQKENDLIKERLELFQRIGSAQLDNVDLQKTITQNIVVEPTLVTAKSIKAAETAAKKIEDLYRKIDDQVFKDTQLFDIDKQKELAGEVEKIYVQTGAKVKKSLKQDFEVDGVEQGFVEIQKIEEALKRLKKQVNDSDFEILKSFDLEKLTAFENKLKILKPIAEGFTEAIGQGFVSLTSSLVQSISTGNQLLDSFISGFISSLTRLGAALLQQAILEKIMAAQSLGSNLTKSNANAITVATSAAAALGPAGALALPGLIASQLALVNGAFAAIPKFSQGGIVGGGSFTGDDILAKLNSGERVLTIQDQSMLSRVLEGNLRSMGSSNEAITVTGVIRGSDILLSNTRATRNNNRFGG